MACYSDRPISSDEEKVYNHLLYWVSMEPPDRLIWRFHQLLIRGSGYPSPDILFAVRQLATSESAEHHFKYILNRCARILIHYWMLQSRRHSAIPELVDQFTAPLPSVQSIYARRLHHLIERFLQTPEYAGLKRLADSIRQALTANRDTDQPLETLVGRYPYFYEHYLVDTYGVGIDRQRVKQLQYQAQQRYETELAHYLTHQLRAPADLIIPTEADRQIIQPVKNPTLLSDPELVKTYQQITGTGNSGIAYRDAARQFLRDRDQTRCYRHFKEDLHQYLTEGIDYGTYRFHHRLEQHVRSILPESESRRVDDFLVLRTCSRVLDLLIVEGPDKPEHHTLIDLINNLGTTATVGLFLKIVLICRKVRSHLEKRFFVLFNHLKSQTRDAVAWLVKALETLQVALSVHFSSTPFPTVI